MVSNIVSAMFVVVFFMFVSWRKYIKHKNPKKQWEGERPKSNEELRQDQNKYRGFGQIPPM
ncbi:hypothetical protein GCM10008983_07800 [Lentibacillus halophilus]|uniref:Uncharacterized protein n=1 Tax=Lentibacillus halophilus TaxID=295065 RepID=A0ABP3IYP4_9BACI